MRNYISLWTEAMPNESLQSFAKINPLVGLPPKTLRLYSALSVLKSRYASGEEPGWFRVPVLDPRVKNLGLSESGLQEALQELMRVGLLRIREEQGIRWYHLKSHAKL